MIKDICEVEPQEGESYFVDTNVWFWMTYVSSKDMSIPNNPEEYQVRDYSNFIEKALGVRAKLYHCALTLAELTNIIENTEWKLYKQYNKDISRKRFRSIRQERKAVVKEVDIAWGAINSISKCLNVNLDSRFTMESHKIYTGSLLDSYDSFFAQFMNENGIQNIITDDSDFKTLSGKNIFTSNPRVLGR